MEPFDLKAVRATVCNASKFARPLAIRLRIYTTASCMPFVCARREGGEERWKKKEEGGGLLMIILEGVCL